MVLDVEGGARITFNDARRFGAVDLWPTGDLEAHRLLAGLGPEPLGNGFDGAYLAERLAGRRTAVKAVLGDQRVVAGLGNIYLCEALWRARISPLRQAGEVTPAEAETLAAAVRAVLAGRARRRRLLAHATTARRTASSGTSSIPSRSTAARARPARAGDGVVARVAQAGRSSFWCPACQT